MYTHRFSTTIIVLAMATALTACGGDGSTSTSTDPSVGAISGFGSIIVNGVRYETENSRIVSADDGSLIVDRPSDNQLRQYLGLGQIVAVRGSRSDSSNGVANSISVDNELVGAITQVSAAEGSFVALGQTVTVTRNTIIDDSIIERVRGGEIDNDLPFGNLSETLDQLLRAGMLVEVNGFPTGNGLEASRIEDVDNRDRIGVGNRNAGEGEVKGFVRNLNGGQFEINSLTVTFDTSDLDDNFGNTGLVEGQFVEVKGNAISETAIDATRIEREDDFSSSNSSSRSNGNEVVGVVSNVTADSFVINGRTVRVNANTLIDDSMIERVRGVELDNDRTFGSLPETLQQLLSATPNVEVHLFGDLAIRIEDL